MSCRYKDICPSYSGWCEGPKQDFSNCVSFLITAYEQAKDELEECKKELREYKNTGVTPEQKNLIRLKDFMQVEIIFKDAAKPKQIECDNIYTKGEMLCVRQGEYIYKYPLINIFSVCHKHGCHIGSIEHQKKNGLIL